jgi:hypothetical protein
MFTNKHIIRFAATLMILLGLSAAVLSGAISVVFASEGGWWVIGAFLLAEVGEFLIPVVAGIRKWNTQLRVAAIICTTASCYSISSYLLDIQAPALIAHTTNGKISQTADTELARAMATLNRLEPMGLGAVDDLTKMVSDADAEAVRLASNDKAKMGDENACFAKCQKAKATAMEVRAKLSQAKDRDEAKKLLGTAKNDRDAHKENASGIALVLKTYAGIETSKSEAGHGFVRALLALLLLKVIVYFTIPGMEMLASVADKTKAPRARRVRETVLKMVEEAKPVAEAVKLVRKTPRPAGIASRRRVEQIAAVAVPALEAPKKAKRVRKAKTEVVQIEDKSQTAQRDRKIAEFGKDRNLVVFVKNRRKVVN